MSHAEVLSAGDVPRLEIDQRISKQTKSKSQTKSGKRKKRFLRRRSNSSPEESPRKSPKKIVSNLASILTSSSEQKYIYPRSHAQNNLSSSSYDSSTESEYSLSDSRGENSNQMSSEASSELSLSSSSPLKEIACPSPNPLSPRQVRRHRRSSWRRKSVGNKTNNRIRDGPDIKNNRQINQTNQIGNSSSSPSFGTGKRLSLRISKSSESNCGSSSETSSGNNGNNSDNSSSSENSIETLTTPRIDGPEIIIGRGSYGVVKSANYRAYKYFEDWPCLVREYPCLISCQGPGVVEVYGYNPYNQCIKMKLYQTDLATWLSQGNYIRGGNKHHLYKFRQHILHNIIQGLATIHARGCVHGDLKPSNILLSSTMGMQLTNYDYENPSSVQVALADFGNVCPNGQGHIKYITPSHRPPLSSKYCPNLEQWVDVYALALVVMELWISDYDSWAEEVCILQDNIPLDDYISRSGKGTNSPNASPGRSVRHSQKIFVELLLKHTSLTGRTRDYFFNIIDNCRRPNNIPNIYQVARDCGAKIISTACPLQYEVGGILSPRSIVIDCDTLGNLQQLIYTASPSPFVAQRSITVFRYALTNLQLAIDDLAPVALIIMRMVSHLSSNNTTYSSLTSILDRIKCPRSVQQLLELEIALTK